MFILSLTLGQITTTISRTTNKTIITMKTLNEFIKCKVYFDNYIDSIFRYTYTSGGVEKTIDVTIVEGDEDIEFHVNGIPSSLTIDNFIGCEDIEDCSLVIAKHVIKAI